MHPSLYVNVAYCTRERCDSVPAVSSCEKLDVQLGGQPKNSPPNILLNAVVKSILDFVN